MARVKSESPLSRVRVETKVLQISNSSPTRVESLRLESTSVAINDNDNDNVNDNINDNVNDKSMTITMTMSMTM